MKCSESTANKEYFNRYLYEQAIDLIESDPYQAKEKLEQYIKQYPKDYSAYPYYASVLIKFDFLDEAKTVLDYVEEVGLNAKIFEKDPIRKKYLRDYILANRVRLFAYQGKYNEAYEILTKYKDDIIGLSMSEITFLCRKHLGLYDPSRREPNSYLFRQIIEYRKDDFLEHIKKHMSEYQNSDNINDCVFNEGFPIYDVIQEVEKYIPSEKKIYGDFCADTYIFKYNDCGKEAYKAVDYIKVVCFHGTTDFITMLPVKEGEYLPHIDLNYMKKEEDSPKTKRLSQSEKFRLKYNLKK